MNKLTAKLYGIFAFSCLLVPAFLSGCDNSADRTADYSATSGTQAVFQVVGANPKDGCTVTRFFRATPSSTLDDRGFYTQCPATAPKQPVTTEYDEPCGKNCTRHVTVTTLGNLDQK